MNIKIKLEQKQDIINQYKEGISPYIIAQQFKVSIKPIYKVLHDAGIVTNRQRKYTVDDTFFSSINTEDKAYWLGFILADGCVQTKINKVHLYLKSSDIAHFIKFNNSINGNYKINEYKFKQDNKIYFKVGFSVASKQWITDLKKYGVVDRKSLTADPNLNYIPDDLQRHFWRGVVDADGSLIISLYYYSIVTVGSKQTCTKFSKWLSKNYDIDKKVTPHESIWELDIGGRLKTRKLAEILYKDSSIFLDRKKIIADRLLESPNFNLRPYTYLYDRYKKDFNRK